MSQIVTRAGADTDSTKKDKPDTPVKDMKKKMSVVLEKVDAKTEKVAEVAAQKPKEDGKSEKNGKESKKPDKKQNGKPERAERPRTNGANGTEEDDLVIIEQDGDEMFPELMLAYDDASDEDSGPSRSVTRRSQVKASRTPETPRPASDKLSDKDAEDDDATKEGKLAKLREELQSRNLRSGETTKSKSKKDGDVVDLVDDSSVDVHKNESSKTDTKYSKTRVKVSPYRRGRLDRTNSSTAANYTGNNTTMEMDITAESANEELSSSTSSWRVRARRSYKPLRELPPRPRLDPASLGICLEQYILAGRKRRPDEERPLSDGGKRMRLLDMMPRFLRGGAHVPFIKPIAAEPKPEDLIEPEPAKEAVEDLKESGDTLVEIPLSEDLVKDILEPMKDAQEIVAAPEPVLDKRQRCILQ